MKCSTVILTVGHSTRTRAEFIRLLQLHVVTCVVNLRTVPRSRPNARFKQDSLPAALQQAGLGQSDPPQADAVLRMRGIAERERTRRRRTRRNGRCGLSSITAVALEKSGRSDDFRTISVASCRRVDARNNRAKTGAVDDPKTKKGVLARKQLRGSKRSPAILTVGHSTRTLDEFIALLRAHKVTRVVDVRTVPRSRHNPQFNKDSLPDSLRKAGLGYIHLPGLGGLRHAKRDSLNAGWRNASFRGYADYMQTPEFAENLERLIALAKEDRIAIMCAEAVPWRCHRSLIGDALMVRGIRTEDIMSLTNCRLHTLTPFAKARGTTVTYPAESPEPAKKKVALKRKRAVLKVK